MASTTTLLERKIQEVAGKATQEELRAEHFVFSYKFEGKDGSRIVRKNSDGTFYDYRTERKYANIDRLARSLGVTDTIVGGKIDFGSFRISKNSAAQHDAAAQKKEAPKKALEPKVAPKKAAPKEGAGEPAAPAEKKAEPKAEPTRLEVLKAWNDEQKAGGKKGMRLAESAPETTGGRAAGETLTFRHPDSTRVRQFTAGDKISYLNIRAKLGNCSGVKDSVALEIANYESAEIDGKIAQVNDAIKRIKKKAGSEMADRIFEVLHRKNLEQLFVQSPEVFARIAETQASAHNIESAFERLAEREIMAVYEGYREGKVKLDSLVLKVNSSKGIAFFNGYDLDYYHENMAARRAFLGSLGNADVLALLCSDPANFYTSSNEMLLNRLKADMGARTVTEYLGEYGIKLDSEEGRNFLFRLANYGWLYNEGNPAKSMLAKGELEEATRAVLAPLRKNKGFDAQYFYWVANCIGAFSMEDGIGRSAIAMEVAHSLNKNRAMINMGGENAQKRAAALEYVETLLDSDNVLVSAAEKYKIAQAKNGLVFDPENYKGADGYVTTVQIFDREDTEKDHWGMSVGYPAWNGAGWKRKDESDENGKTMVFENRKMMRRVVLHMGNAKGENAGFARRMIAENNGLIIAYRGHSYNLANNVPKEIFANKGSGSYLLIPGSCGSSSSVPRYMMGNPSTNLSFIANNQVGIGNVTNAIVGYLAGVRGQVGFREMEETLRPQLAEYGMEAGNMSFQPEGYCLLKYVNKRAGGAGIA